MGKQPQFRRINGRVKKNHRLKRCPKCQEVKARCGRCRLCYRCCEIKYGH